MNENGSSRSDDFEKQVQGVLFTLYLPFLIMYGFYDGIKECVNINKYEAIALRFVKNETSGKIIAQKVTKSAYSKKVHPETLGKVTAITFTGCDEWNRLNKPWTNEQYIEDYELWKAMQEQVYHGEYLCSRIAVPEAYNDREGKVFETDQEQDEMGLKDETWKTMARTIVAVNAVKGTSPIDKTAGVLHFTTTKNFEAGEESPIGTINLDKIDVKFYNPYTGKKEPVLPYAHYTEFDYECKKVKMPIRLQRYYNNENLRAIYDKKLEEGKPCFTVYIDNKEYFTTMTAWKRHPPSYKDPSYYVSYFQDDAAVVERVEALNKTLVRNMQWIDPTLSVVAAEVNDDCGRASKFNSLNPMGMER